ncbi:hypothetical protein CGH02_21480 [Vibrio parahaemolyticus]|uniref:hypothetical protein n=1 Tax=Vibrio parahaemolyticus TaxID=670 RepID=UPI00111D5E0D|nr:hypothetical protein [Vibrio parahaemolyticus]EGS6501040.1 hypothetical protein [Vibrio parahaemolyticus]ELF4880047.1 hypothetical protein [Vibrio parahaemolyticus]TOE05562.1 hypothetical protein CGJ50_22545 [Vibrio parahaemolyticus]TOH99073.1 hypothetical protein CGI69_21735 [Vibrio parahaemolyticus]TOI98397.1 hypothetical protein CGI48_22520 [Vibrio parahaemolyticus]
MFKFFRHMLFSGLATCTSLACFASVVYLGKPILEVAFLFYDNNEMSTWFKYNVFDLGSLKLNIVILVYVVLSAIMGLMSSMLAKLFYEKAYEQLKTLDKKYNKAFKSDSQRLAFSLRSSIAKRCSHLNAALYFCSIMEDKWTSKRDYQSLGWSYLKQAILKVVIAIV